MSQWEDRFNEHAIHTTLANLDEKLASEEISSEDSNMVEFLDKVIQAISYAHSCLKNTIPALINIGNLNNANSQLTNVLNEVNNYIANKNIAHLNNTANHVDAAIAQLKALPTPNQAISEETFSASLSRFKSLVEASLHHTKKLTRDVESSLEAITSDSQQNSAELTNLAGRIQEFQDEISTSITEFKESFATLQNESKEQIALSIQQGEERLDSFLDAKREEHATQLKKQEVAAATILDVLDKKKSEASNLVQIIGNIGITGNYQKIANQEKQTADRWRNIALILMIGMVGAIALTIFVSVENGFDWKLALFRLAATLVLAIPAAYAARESSRHRASENFNRKAELELASLDPFLEKLPEEKRNQIKENLTEKFFGLEVHAKHDDEPVTYGSLLELIKLAIKNK